MNAALKDVSKKTRWGADPEEKTAEELVSRAKEQGPSLTGPDELLKQLTKTVLETALGQEMAAWQTRPLDAALRGRVHRRDHGEGPGRAGREPAGLCRDRGQPGHMAES
jgi:hypothetical protein